MKLHDGGIFSFPNKLRFDDGKILLKAFDYRAENH